MDERREKETYFSHRCPTIHDKSSENTRLCDYPLESGEMFNYELMAARKEGFETTPVAMCL